MVRPLALLLTLLVAGVCTGFSVSMSSSSSNGGDSTSQEVVLSLSSKEHPNIQEMLKPLEHIREHMHRLAKHMDSLFGDDPFDVDSFFNDPFKHFRAMERALMPHPPSRPTSPPSLLEHLDTHKDDPRVAVAAACHTLLPQCMRQSGQWNTLYRCLMLRKQFASPKCSTMLHVTREQLAASNDNDESVGDVADQTDDHDDTEISKDEAEDSTDDLKGEATPGYLTGDVEAPQGTKDMGGWVSRVYTSEQQHRLGVDQFGEPIKSSVQSVPDVADKTDDHEDTEVSKDEPETQDPKAEDNTEGSGRTEISKDEAEDSTDDLKGEATPGYLTGDVEAPQGTKDMGGWVSRVYTSEQQHRLGVDQFGEPVKKGKPAPLEDHRSDTQVPFTHEMIAKIHLAARQHHALFTVAVLVALLCGAWLCCRCCCRARKTNSLDATYTVLLESETTKMEQL